MILFLVLLVAVSFMVLVGVLLHERKIICPSCKKEFKDFTTKGYDYHSEFYCPHCNYEFK